MIAIIKIQDRISKTWFALATSELSPSRTGIELRFCFRLLAAASSALSGMISGEAAEARSDESRGGGLAIGSPPMRIGLSLLGRGA